MKTMLSVHCRRRTCAAQLVVYLPYPVCSSVYPMSCREWSAPCIRPSALLRGGVEALRLYPSHLISLRTSLSLACCADTLEYAPWRPLPADPWSGWNLGREPVRGNVVADDSWWERYGVEMCTPNVPLKQLVTRGDDGLWTLK